MFCPLHSFIEMFSIMITLLVEEGAGSFAFLWFHGLCAVRPLDHFQKGTNKIFMELSLLTGYHFHIVSF